MAIGDVYAVESCRDWHYLDTGMYDVPEYGSVYVVDAERPAVVDTGIGTNYERVLDALETVGIAPADLAVVAPTHVHLDHAGGAGFLAEACPNAEVVVHEIGAPHLVDPTRLVEGTKRAVRDEWRHYVDPRPVPVDRVREVSDGDVVDLGDHALSVHHAPGHAPHQVVFRDDATDAVFTADAAGIRVPETGAVRPTTPPPNFDLEQCLADVEMLADLEPGTLCYGHFGPWPTGDALETYADVLSAWVAEVERVRAKFGDDEAVVEHFVETTDMAPVWGESKARADASLNTRGVLTYLDRRED